MDHHADGERAQTLPSSSRATSRLTSASSAEDLAGVAAAIEFLKTGHKVVLLDKNHAGGSSSVAAPASSRLTANSSFISSCRYGRQGRGRNLERAAAGHRNLVASIQKHDIQCGLIKQDSLFLGLGKGGSEAGDLSGTAARSRFHFDQEDHDEAQLKTILGATGYTAGIRYGGTYGVNLLACLQGFKNLLVDHGMQIFEHGDEAARRSHRVHASGSVTADKIIIVRSTSSTNPSAHSPTKCSTHRPS